MITKNKDITLEKVVQAIIERYTVEDRYNSYKEGYKVLRYNNFHTNCCIMYIGNKRYSIDVRLNINPDMDELYLDTANLCYDNVRYEPFDNFTCSVSNTIEERLKFLYTIRSILYDNIEIDHSYITDCIKFLKISESNGNRNVQYNGKHTILSRYCDPDALILAKEIKGIYSLYNFDYENEYPYCQDIIED